MEKKWVAIGCAAFVCGILPVLFCLALVGGAILTDSFNLYCSLPFGAQIFNCP